MNSIDINMIRSYIKVTEQRQNVGIEKGQDPFEVWRTQKGFLYRLLGNKLIVEKEVSFNKPDYVIEQQMSDLMYGDYRFIETINNYLLEKYHTSFNYYDFGTNSYEGRSITLSTNKEKKNVKIEKGVKLIKAIRKVLEYLDKFEEFKNQFEEFRIQHSQILNDKVQKGTLCLSIHPLDFFTMSDNANGWTSCMSWYEKGCYRVGTIEMLNSPYVMVAYLKSNSDEITWDNYTWNSKKWRSLIVLDENICVVNKNYPFYSKDLSTECLNLVRELAKENLSRQYDKQIRTLDFENGCENEWNEGYIEGISSDYAIGFETNYMYNDLYSEFDCIVSKEYLEKPFTYTINYSGEITCPYCGDYIDYEDIDDKSEVLCFSCRKMKKCPRCECLTFEEELAENEICNRCNRDIERQHCNFCGQTEKTFFENKAILCSIGQGYFPYEIDFYVCEECFKKYYKNITHSSFGYHCIDLTDPKVIEYMLNNLDIYEHFFDRLKKYRFYKGYDAAYKNLKHYNII